MFNLVYWSGKIPFKPRVPAPASLALLGMLAMLVRPAEASLNYYIYQDGDNVTVKALSNGLTLPKSLGPISCSSGWIQSYPGVNIFCSGALQASSYKLVHADGTSQFNQAFGYTTTLSTGDTPSGIIFGSRIQEIFGSYRLLLDSHYSAGDPISTTTIFLGISLTEDLGFTTPGLFASWSLQPPDPAKPPDPPGPPGPPEPVGFSDVPIPSNGYDTVNWIVGAPPGAAAPGPLPVLGAGAFYGFSRRLRRRLQSHQRRPT